MYLKNLTVLGFKSFADKTSLNFQPGVSAIVGPNGCGKSNVSDAIRWVLGEQSAKALRGGEMADVIFNGTDGRKPLGMAEVSLTIGGVDEEHLRAAGVEVAYNEVTLTRRVFRDGGSEYFINKTPCRLKDVQQLFMGTGVGRTSYSIMAQGNITQILSSKPDDRRMVFEEAAGITKFKSQKKEALRKLEYTDQNLLRVSDLIREVKRQIGSLQRQAGKARRYKTLMTELQHLDTQLARHQFDVLQTEIGERQQSSEKLRVEVEVCTESVLRVENEIIQLRERLSELDQQISQSQQRGLELRAQTERHEHRIHFDEERLLELEAQHGKALAEIAEADERKRIAEEELTAVAARLGEAAASLDGHRQTLEQRRQALQAVESEQRERQEQLRQAQAEAFQAAQQLSRTRNELTALELQQQGNVVRLEKLSAEKIQLEEERQRLETRLQEFAASVETEKLNAQMCRGTVEERQERLVQVQQEITAVSQELDRALRQQAETRSRLNVLEQLQSEHEGFSAGAMTALKQSDRVLGSLADRIRVPDEYVTAIEAALGHHLQLVLTAEAEAAQGIIEQLNAAKKGRASVAALGLVERFNSDRVEEEGDSNFETLQSFSSSTLESFDNSALKPIPAVSVVEMDESVRPLVQRLLGMTRITPDLEAATEAWRESNGAFHYVTHGGDILSRHGVYTGGTSNGSGQATASILGRKNQIAELQSAVARVQEQVSEISRRKGALQSEQTELQASLQEAQSELRAQEVAIATREGEFKALETSQRTLHQKIDTVVYEIQSLAAQEQEGLQKRAAVAAQAGELETRERATQDKVGALTAALEGLRQQRDVATTALTETKVTLAAQEQLCAALRQQQQPLEQRIRELSDLAAQRRNEIGVFGTRKTQWEAEIEDSRRQIERLQHEREVVSNQTAALISERDTQDSEVSSREETLREQRRRLSEIQQQRSAIEVELAQKNMTVQNLRERIQQKYQVNLDDVRSECITITIADEGPPKVQTLTPEEMAAAGAATDWNAVAEQVAALQRRIDEMGPVNLVAIEEYEETEQRHTFLSTQYEDLVKAKEQLLDVINRINTQTKEMFVDTFNKIRDNFRALFTEIFGGGKADLMLVDEGDVLESGIDIVARPPGKQLQSISLLSGGEQTMTAVALLFSIYQVKPSPFCVLDELDAPLDESNINRFIRVLQRFLVHSQFIIITHNKRTIGMADVLYGVTMEEQGVSKIVSVRFHKAEEGADENSATTLEGTGSAPEPEAEEEVREETEELVMAK
ncbi:MAG: chromosome segregation protein SMC [Verrucomicrobia subdivision 3 bacterium]|nr:chromosome segregation protein SMC [Limisphaerales bacterium]